MKKFRRGKKFQDAYFEIGSINSMISNLQIELDSFLEHNNKCEAQSREDQIIKLKNDLKKYDPNIYDIGYCLPQVSGLYVKQNKRDILNQY